MHLSAAKTIGTALLGAETDGYSNEGPGFLIAAKSLERE
jgi:hypothetical protein